MFTEIVKKKKTGLNGNVCAQAAHVSLGFAKDITFCSSIDSTGIVHDTLWNCQRLTNEKLREYIGKVTAMRSAAKKELEGYDKDQPEWDLTFL